MTRLPHSSDTTVIQDVEVWSAQSVRKHCDVTIREGKLIEVTPTSTARRANRLVIMPSAVDTQVHMRTPGQWDKETPETAAMAAIKGGIGAVLTMPNTKPTLDSVTALALAQELMRSAEKRFGLRVLYSVAGTIGQKGVTVAPLADLFRAGAVAVTDDGRGVEEDGVQAEILRQLETIDMPFLQHAETAGAEGPLADGLVTRRLGLKPYRAEHETEMVERDLRLLEKSPGARYHLLHMSSAGSIPLIKAAKAKGLRVTAEVSPHHLYFCADDIDETNKSFKMNPPLRSEADREALIDALASGVIDWVATDHAPHEADSKAKSFVDATFGTLGLETMVPVVFDLVSRQRLSPTRAIEALSSKPAEFLGISSEFGHLRTGAPARLALIHPDERWTVHASQHSSLSKNTCFDGINLKGRVVGQINASGIWTTGFLNLNL